MYNHNQNILGEYFLIYYIIILYFFLVEKDEDEDEDEEGSDEDIFADAIAGHNTLPTKAGTFYYEKTDKKKKIDKPNSRLPSINTPSEEKDILVCIITATQLLCNYTGTWLDRTCLRLTLILQSFLTLRGICGVRADPTKLLGGAIIIIVIQEPMFYFILHNIE